MTSGPEGGFPLASALRRLGHRGPDELGMSEHRGVGLAAARLALVGGDAGRQPLLPLHKAAVLWSVHFHLF